MLTFSLSLSVVFALLVALNLSIALVLSNPLFQSLSFTQFVRSLSSIRSHSSVSSQSFAHSHSFFSTRKQIYVIEIDSSFGVRNNCNTAYNVWRKRVTLRLLKCNALKRIIATTTPGTKFNSTSETLCTPLNKADRSLALCTCSVDENFNQLNLGLNGFCRWIGFELNLSLFLFLCLPLTVLLSRQNHRIYPVFCQQPHSNYTLDRFPVVWN